MSGGRRSRHLDSTTDAICSCAQASRWERARAVGSLRRVRVIPVSKEQLHKLDESQMGLWCDICIIVIPAPSRSKMRQGVNLGLEIQD